VSDATNRRHEPVTERDGATDRQRQSGHAPTVSGRTGSPAK
jgi:hypothetical protein